MGSRSEALAKQFEAKVQEAVAVFEQLSAADWNKVTEAEHWTVGVTAHHLASALEPVAGMVTAIVSGQSPGHFTTGHARRDERQARAGARPLHQGGDHRAPQEGRGSGRRGGPWPA